MASTNPERQIVLALQAIEQDPNLSARKATQIYSCSHAALSRRLKGTQSCEDSIPNSRNPTFSEEETIFQYLVDLDARLHPPVSLPWKTWQIDYSR